MTKRFVKLACLLVMLTACTSVQPEEQLSRLIFDRGHGSVWGNQFYMEVCREEIVTVQWIPEGAGDPVTREHIPISSEDWEQIVSLVKALQPKLEKDTPSLWEKLVGKHKLDGDEYRKLTIQWGTEETQYKWPQDAVAERLEVFLEELGERSG